MPLGVIPGDVEEGAGVLGEVFNEPPVEVGEAPEGLHLFLVCWGRPFCNSGHLDQVHSNGVVGYDHSEVLNCCLFKLAFVQSKVQLVLLQ